MKKILSLLLFLVICNSAFAQCGNRYVDTIFSNVTITDNVVYGNNTSIGGTNMDLKMEIYEPTGDTYANRPVIILAHGGSFIGGDRNSADMVYLCTQFAKRGYLTASIEYRLFDIIAFPDSNNMFNVVIKAVGDMKAAIRYFRKDRATTNMFRADTSQIFIGGTSAGAITAINAAYIDNPSEVPAYISTIIASNGGIEGNSGNPGYSSKAKAIINICGAVGKQSWIDAADEPVVSFHGTADNVVPYAYGCATVSGFCVAYVDGSANIHARATSLGINSFLRTHNGAGHVPFSLGGATGALYMDTTETDIVNFLSPLTLCDTTTVGIKENETSVDFQTFPNPVKDVLVVKSNEIIDIQICSIDGKVLWQHHNTVRESIDMSTWTKGMYLVNVRNAKGVNSTKKIIIE